MKCSYIQSKTQTRKVEKFNKAGCRGISRTLSNIYDGAVNYIHRNASSQIFDRVENKHPKILTLKRINAEMLEKTVHFHNLRYHK